MSLFGKKKETAKEAKAPSCSCGCNCQSCEPEKVEKTSTCCPETENSICCIKVLGPGCKNCHALLESTQKAVANMGLKAEVEYVTDMEKVMTYGVMSMPALVVNEKVVSMGKVYKPEEVEILLHKLGF